MRVLRRMLIFILSAHTKEKLVKKMKAKIVFFIKK